MSGPASFEPYGVASSATAGTDESAATRRRPAERASLEIRIGYGLVRSARMGHGAVEGRTNRLSIFPQVTRACRGRARGPRRAACGEFLVRELHVERALDRVDDDDVA